MTETAPPIVVSVAADAESFRTVVALRRIVFGEEQRILLSSYEDPEDEFSFNLLATINGHPVGTGRLSPPFGRHSTPTITWVATLPEFRGLGVATAIVGALVREADARGYKTVYLNAQAHALGLYLAHGFERIGLPQVIHGIPHQAMVRRR